ncbi:MAG: M28 family peptidase [Planctomycetota bacterium]|nr:M28 family peptidase [Planctomycetota bacterium]
MWCSFLFVFLVGPAPQVEEKVKSDPLQVHIEALSDDELEGRNAGSPGAKRAAQYIVERLREYQLLPGPDGAYVQRFSFPLFDLEDRHSLQPTQGKGFNVVGFVEGGSRSEEVVMVVSHYDHLGREGQPNPGRRPEKGGDKIWNGANDNASGMAAFLSLAESVAAMKPERTFLFVAFSAKEHRQQGSLWYRDHPLIPFRQVVFVLSIDRVGRLQSSPLEVHGVGTGRELRPLVEASLAAETVKATLFDHAGVRNSFGDQVIFYEEGIPTILMTALPQRLDRTSRDHSDQIDLAALQKVTRSALGILTRIDQAVSPLPFVKGRRFGFLQGGTASAAFIKAVGLEENAGAILVLEVSPDTVASRAGVKKGDWILSFNETSLPRFGAIQALRRSLDAISPGKPVPVVVLRGRKKVSLQAEWSE